MVKEEKLMDHIIPVDEMFSQYPAFTSAGGELDKLLSNGNTFPHHLVNQQAEQKGWLRVYDSTGRFIGIYEYHSDEKLWKPKKIFLGGD